ncbi:MAG: hypothetical protein EOP06_02850 [Proteobacteria bacterium]|nr:MAG: hypothetical protein EOP06_02850 [Pseudomonadota bacterium]
MAIELSKHGLEYQEFLIENEFEHSLTQVDGEDCFMVSVEIEELEVSVSKELREAMACLDHEDAVSFTYQTIFKSVHKIVLAGKFDGNAVTFDRCIHFIPVAKDKPCIVRGVLLETLTEQAMGECVRAGEAEDSFEERLEVIPSYFNPMAIMEMDSAQA